jgi:hypothetical protein
MNLKIIMRIAAAISLASITSGFTKWPDIMFITSCLFLAIWLHAEWDWLRSGGE